MPENNQASDKTKPEATGSSSTQPGSQAIDMNHTNVIVPHRISNHDKLVQTMVMVDGEWVNVNDTNDQKNVQEDMHKVNRVVTEAQKEIINAQNAADSAVKSADSAISASKVNSDAITAQGEAISEAKIALDSAAAEIQLTASNAASDAAKIRADVARVQNEVDTAKAANSASVEALKSDIGTTKQDLANVHDSLTKAQSAVEQNQKLINDSVAKISNDITQDRKDLATAQQNNADLAKQLDDYSKQAEAQGKTIKSIQDKQDSFTATLADVQGNVSQVSDKVDGLSASLKDAQGNVATVKAQADQLNATLTDHAKSIATLTASAKELSSTLEDADGRLSKVEQTAQTNSSTLSDVQGDLSQVKQQADGLVTTLKDAQGSITQIQQKADGALAQLKSAQGDIASLQTDVTGIKATLVSHEGDIHTLQADSKSLHDSMQDAQGDISTLKKTSTDVTSELKDHAGRISKTEQTASTLVNEFADQQGHLNRVEQTATGTQQTVANQQGQINTIKTDANGIHEALTGQGNQIANINVTLNGLNTKYEGVSVDLNKLKSQAQWATVTSAVDLNNVKTPCHEFLKGTVTNAPNEVAWWYLTVESSDDGNRVTQTVIADQSNNRYTRRWADSWSAWVKDATQTDVTALSNRITTNSTQIDQNKKSIALKADQATVDNLSGEVNQNTAQLKVQADQISSKVSSTEYQTLKDKVNGMKIGGRNYILNSAKKVFSPVGQDNYDLFWNVSKEALNANPDKNGQYKTHFSFDMQASSALPTARTWRIYWRASPWTSFGIITYPANTTNVQHYELKITTPATQPIADEIFIRFMKEDTGKPSYTITNSLLTIGDVFEDYSPNPDDTITSIQKNTTAIDENSKAIKLKADATEVNSLKGTVNSHSASINLFSNQLKSMVTESKVNDIINGKGFTTQSTVQSLIDQKAGTLNESITNLSTELKNNSGGGVNLLLNTGTLQFSANVTSQTNNPNSANSLWHLSVGSLAEWLKDNPNITKLGISYDYELTGTTKASGIIRFGVNQAPAWEYMSGYNLDDKPLKGRAKIIIDVTDAMRNTRTDITRIRGDGLPIGATLKITHPKWEIGAVTPYSQAPSDNASVNQLQSVTASIDGLQSTVKDKADKSQITQLSNLVQSKVSASDFNNLRKAVDLQTLDSADINNMKTNGHYFVRNLANNPVGGWVYVDVTGNGADRIRQDVYQDSGNQHKYRRWFGTYWTGWEEGATESEITQLRDDINLRVKSGDLLSQINVEAGRTLIQSNKIYFDADSFVMSPNSKAFIPSAFITDLSADKITSGTLDAGNIRVINLTADNIHGGTLDVGDMHVKNFSANDITTGTLTGIDIKAGDNDNNFELKGQNIHWNRKVHYEYSNGASYDSSNYAVIGQFIDKNFDYGSYAKGDALTIGDHNEIRMGLISTYQDVDGSSQLGMQHLPKIVITYDDTFNPYEDRHQAGSLHNKQQINIWTTTKEFLRVVKETGIEAHLDDTLGAKSTFNIQKDNCVGAYFGQGDAGNQINFNLGGDGCGFNVNGPLHVTGSKNSIVETRQGYLAINAYETAEYYFGDIGENNTGDTSQVVIGIDRIFNEVVNTDIQYQVFVTPYSNAHVWVEKRYNNRFIVKSDRPNAEFGWELKAKRKGYESNRLRRIDVDFNQMNLKGEN